MKKFISAVLLAALLAVTLTACSGGGDNVMTLGKYRITDGMYGYWMVSLKSYFLKTYADASDTDEFWESEVEEGKTMEQYITEIVDLNVRNYLIGMKLFDDYGLSLTESALEDVELQVSDMIESCGSRAAANTMLGEYDINLDIFEEIMMIEKKLECVYDLLYGDAGIESPTDAELDAYYKANYHRIKYIYINCTDRFVYDDNGNITYDAEGYYATELLTEEEVAEKRAKVESALARAQDGEDFDSLVLEFSEVDMTDYPNGLYISNNDVGNYGIELISAVLEMKADEVRLVDDGYDSYIVLKCSLIEEAYKSEVDEFQFGALSEYAAIEKYEAKFGAEAESVIYNRDAMARYAINP